MREFEKIIPYILIEIFLNSYNLKFVLIENNSFLRGSFCTLKNPMWQFNRAQYVELSLKLNILGKFNIFVTDTMVKSYDHYSY